MYTIQIFVVWLTSIFSYINGFTVGGFYIKRMLTVDISAYSHELIRCAYQCLASHDCCVATYDTTNHTCTFDYCCFKYQGNVSQPNIIKMVKTSRLVDCSDLACGTNVSGMYEIFSDVQPAVEVFCIFGENNIPWTVIQQRLYGDVDFEKNWEEYKKGFGSPNSDYWIGNDILHILTNKRPYTLRFDMEDFAGETAFAEYTTFSVDDEANKYKLTVGGYSGDAGDSFMANNNNMFSTFDSDNDALNGQCALNWKGGWWFYRCGQCNPNGPFSTMPIADSLSNMMWSAWRGLTQLKTMQMKISPYL